MTSSKMHCALANDKPRRRFGAPLHDPNPKNSISTPTHYATDLTPRPSSFRPHCLARDRLRLWKPANPPPRASSHQDADVSETQLDRILDVINASWAESTKSTYGAGLLVFHVFCDIHDVPEGQRCPTSPTLLLSFLSSCAGSYSGASLNNYVAGLKAWHLLHGHKWDINPSEIKAVLEGASRLAPPTSRRPNREPFTPDLIVRFRSHINLNDPLDAAIFACMTICFWAVARLGELTVPNINSFDTTKHVTLSGVSKVVDRDGNQVTKFRIPITKMSGPGNNGEYVQCASQEGHADPIAALDNHLRLNKVGPNDHLFAWKTKDGLLRPLSRRQVITFILKVAKLHGLPNLKGHSLRIGGTLEYLLRGVPFDAIQAQGRWAGRAFTLYLRKHAMILAPYLQASPTLEPFTRYTQPPVR